MDRMDRMDRGACDERVMSRARSREMYVSPRLRGIGSMLKRITLLLLVLVLLAAPSPAFAAQLDASDGPRTRGPLTKVSKRCIRDVKRSDGGQVIAKFALCRWFFRFRPSRETNPNRNFGAWWMQGVVDAQNGWCTKWTKANTNLPDGWKGVAPKLGTDRRGPQTYTSRLVIDAQGATATPGRLSQDFIIRRGKMTAFRPRPSRYRVKWEGRPTPDKLAYAYGVEMSYPQGGSPGVANPSIQAHFRRPC
jgi:hypothetical protein